ncbi:MAG: hypothetical protein ACLFR1_07005 [Spirochaetia bacterium]
MNNRVIALAAVFVETIRIWLLLLIAFVALDSSTQLVRTLVPIWVGGGNFLFIAGFVVFGVTRDNHIRHILIFGKLVFLVFDIALGLVFVLQAMAALNPPVLFGLPVSLVTFIVFLLDLLLFVYLLSYRHTKIPQNAEDRQEENQNTDNLPDWDKSQVEEG